MEGVAEREAVLEAEREELALLEVPESETDDQEAAADLEGLEQQFVLAALDEDHGSSPESGKSVAEDIVLEANELPIEATES